MIQNRFDPSIRDSVEHVDGGKTRPARHIRRIPEAPDPIERCRIVEIHMRCELIGEPADLASAHCIGLAGEREGTRALLADPPRREMAIDDRIDLVGAGRGLVDALRIGGDGFFRRSEIFIEQREIARIEAAAFGDRGKIRRIGLGGGERFRKARRMLSDIININRIDLSEMREQPVEDENIRAGSGGKM